MIDSIVRFHFSGWTRSGESFLSTLPSGREVQIPLVSIPSAALVEAIKTLSVGEKRRFWIPGALMGRDKGMQVPPGDLTYDIELIDFQQ
jgi:FKBP-type peptidyl-prolyl cis-trans isomerase